MMVKIHHPLWASEVTRVATSAEFPDRMQNMAVPPVSLIIDAPPEVVQIGSALHGIYNDREVFTLDDLWQMHFYLYDTRIVAGEFSGMVRGGDISLWPPGTRVDQTFYGRSRHMYVHFRQPREGIAREVPMVQHSGRSAGVIGELLLSAIGASVSNRSQVTADVWSVLCRVADLQLAPEAPGPVAAAMRVIEGNLSETLSVPLLARGVGLSHNQLTRQFRAATGRTVVAYIRGRRMAHARHLLTSSTLPVASIAARVGIPDLQAFNKSSHLELGASPRDIRAGYRSSPMADVTLAAMQAQVDDAGDLERPRHYRLDTGQEIFLDAPVAGMETLAESVLASVLQSRSYLLPPKDH